MPSTFTASARYTLQATGENNNTWGVILNQGVFQLVDDNVNGRLAFALSTVKTLTTALGAPDEARMAFLDVTGGVGGAVVIPASPKGYFMRNGAAGAVSVTAGGAVNAIYSPGDAGPCFSDGANVYPILISGLTISQYIAATVTAGSDLPAPLGNLGKVMIVRNVGGPPVELWVPDFLAIADVTGLQAALEDAVAFALTL